MPYKLVYFDEALRDVKEAKKWYKSQQDGLEKRFSVFVKSALVKIEENPEINAIRHKNLRFQHVVKFQYVIHGKALLRRMMNANLPQSVRLSSNAVLPVRANVRVQQLDANVHLSLA